MPRKSIRKELLRELDEAGIEVALARRKHILACLDSSGSDSDSPSSMESGSSGSPFIITPPSPLSPFLSEFDSDSTGDSADSCVEGDAEYCQVLNAIQALRDEVERARVLEKPDAPMMRASQIPLLDHFAEHRPHLFRKKLRMMPEIFDCILDQISPHAIFQSNSQNRQLPVALQLAIFLFRAGHYGNAASPEDVAQWAGVSVGSVVNCTNRVMAAILDQHDLFVNIPSEDSEDMEMARELAEAKTCPAWRNGVFAADGSAIPLFAKPSIYGETFYDRKSRYSLNCQVRTKD